MKKIIIALIILGSQTSWAGGASAQFSCKSDSGRTTLEASVPGDFVEHSVDFNIDGEEVNWFSGINQSTYEVEENSSLLVLGSLQEKNYHFIALNSDGQKVFTFSAIPSSIKLEATSNGELGSLKARITGVDPRGGELQSPVIVVNCTYGYEI